MGTRTLFRTSTAPMQAARRTLAAPARSFSDKADEHFKVPSTEEACCAVRRFREATNDTIFILAISGHHGACKERLVREIMRVDQCTWEAGRAKMEEVNTANDQSQAMVQLPYILGMSAGVIGSFSSIPMVFHRPTAAWFNDRFVHEALPEDGGLEALDTFWKVGNWTWGWMEPYLGTASFVLLGFQFSRSQLQRLNWKPYTEAVVSWRANRLADAFPQYDRQIIRDFSKLDPWTE